MTEQRAIEAVTETPYNFEEVTKNLSKAPIFNVLSHAERVELVESGQVRIHPRGALLMKQGEVETFAYYILDGAVRIEVENQGLAAVVATLDKDSIVGELGAFVSSERLASVTAETDCVLLQLDQATINKIILRNPQLALAVIKELGTRLATLNAAVTIMTKVATTSPQSDAEPTLISALTREAGRHGHLSEAFNEFAQDIQRKNERLIEMETAERIQKSLLPAALEDPSGSDRFVVTGDMIPAKHVGGDFFDYFMINPDTMAIAVGDVSGKGVPAALVMSISRTILRSVAQHHSSAAGILAELNNQLMNHAQNDYTFVTVAVGLIDLNSGRATLASAGLADVHVLKTETGVATYTATGPAIGIIRDADFDEFKVFLEPGDTVVMATDGVSEANNSDGEMFRHEGVRAVLDDCVGATADKTLSTLLTRVQDFVSSAPQFDDITTLVLQYRATEYASKGAT